MADLILCRSDHGDGGWSLHAPGVSDEEIATGAAPPLLSGPAEWDLEWDRWDRPNDDDYAAAYRNLAREGSRE